MNLQQSSWRSTLVAEPGVQIAKSAVITSLSWSHYLGCQIRLCRCHICDSLDSVGGGCRGIFPVPFCWVTEVVPEQGSLARGSWDEGPGVVLSRLEVDGEDDLHSGDIHWAVKYVHRVIRIWRSRVYDLNTSSACYSRSRGFSKQYPHVRNPLCHLQGSRECWSVGNIWGPYESPVPLSMPEPWPWRLIDINSGDFKMPSEVTVLTYKILNTI